MEALHLPVWPPCEPALIEARGSAGRSWASPLLGGFPSSRTGAHTLDPVSVQESRDLLKRTIAVPVASLGRIVDIFDKLAIRVAEKASAFSENELDIANAQLTAAKEQCVSKLRAARAEASEQLGREQRRLAAMHEADVAERLRVERERAEVALAKERERLARDASKPRERSQSPDAPAAARPARRPSRAPAGNEVGVEPGAEVGAAGLEEEAAEPSSPALSAAMARIAELEEAARRSAQAWAAELSAVFHASSLGEVAVKMEEPSEGGDATRPWLSKAAKKPNPKEWHRRIERLGSPAEQLREMTRAYEDQLAALVDERQAQHGRVQAAAAEASAKVEAAQRKVAEETAKRVASEESVRGLEEELAAQVEAVKCAEADAFEKARSTGVCMRACVHVCMCMCACACVHLHVCMFHVKCACACEEHWRVHACMCACAHGCMRVEHVHHVGLRL